MRYHHRALWKSHKFYLLFLPTREYFCIHLYVVIEKHDKTSFYLFAFKQHQKNFCLMLKLLLKSSFFNETQAKMAKMMSITLTIFLQFDSKLQVFLKINFGTLLKVTCRRYERVESPVLWRVLLQNLKLES